MDIFEAKLKINELYQKINYHNKQYYNMDSPEITDYEYDMLQRELKQLEIEYPELVINHSPTKNVGGFADKKFSKVTHKVKMESLQDAFNFEEVKKFGNRISEFDNNIDFSVEPKIDGLSVSLEYKNGKFFRGSTRGDGIIGENVTKNLLSIKNIPHKLIGFEGDIEVRGEVFMPRNSFFNLLLQQEILGEKVFKNPRNAAAGSLRQKDPGVTASRDLDVYIFNIQSITGESFNSHIDSLNFLKGLGFSVLPSYKKCNCIEDAINEIRLIGDKRGDFSFDIDGAVIKVNNLELRHIIGSTSKFPKWAIAYKFPPEEKSTILREIEINIGRTGAATPTAVFDPISLAGTTVGRAVLHNQDFIAEKNINIGDTIIVRKAGDIIPEVVRIESKGNLNSYFVLPNNCPSCGAIIHKGDDEVVARCTNINCPAQLLRNLTHFVSRDAMNIEGMGPAVIEQMANGNLIKNAADIYKLTAVDIEQLERMGEQSAANTISAINQSKGNDLSKLLFAFGIRHVGVKAGKLLAAHFTNIDALLSADIDEIKSIDGIGEKIAESVYDFFLMEETKKLINELRASGVNMESANSANSSALKNLIFVITGTFTNFSRSEMSELIEKNGGKVSSSVSKKTSYVVEGAASGSKIDKANELSIPIITEAELLELLNV